jgi:hypothetical protein
MASSETPFTLEDYWSTGQLTLSYGMIDCLDWDCVLFELMEIPEMLSKSSLQVSS